MNAIMLEGCTATPLAGYLKALGVLRLLSAKYPETRGAWRGDRFVLTTSLDREGIEQFFLNDYAPTPIMAPWNGGSGFYEKDNKDALLRIVRSEDPRLRVYQTSLAIAESALAGYDRSASPKDDDKARLLTAIRSQLPDTALGWFDASVLLAGESPQYPPLLGTGGNDGRLDFTNNFMQRVLDVLPMGDDAVTQATVGWLQTALFAKTAPGLAKSSIGQFSPGQAGGPNASVGFDADATINPWDFVLMIEGSLLFAAAAVRRNADDPFGVLSYPFTVRAVGAGAGSLGESDVGSARGELWMPLWTQPAAYAEVQALMSEGRVALGRKPARDALDFVRAVQHLGAYRGVRSFQRYGLLMRSGKAYLAAPLARINVAEAPTSSWLDELDANGWLERFRRFANDANTANRFKTLRKRLEDRLFALAGKIPSKPEAQALLTLLGEIQSGLSVSSKARDAVRPLPRLSERWVIAADDDTPTFRVAKALAGLRGVDNDLLPMRAQLFPVHRRFDQWLTPDAGEKNRICDGTHGQLVDTLPNLLRRRLWLAERLAMPDKPLDGPAGAGLDDIAAFLRDDRMDARISDLLSGLALCDIPEDIDRSAGNGVAPAAFALMKLSLTPERTLRSLEALTEGQRLPIPAGMLAQLAAGNHDNRAVTSAWRRLRASGLSLLFPSGALPTLAGISPKRAAAALLIPLRFGATAALTRAVLKQPETESV
jgi:CRISPR-associated protein Csx17